MFILGPNSFPSYSLYTFLSTDALIEHPVVVQLQKNFPLLSCKFQWHASMQKKLAYFDGWIVLQISIQAHFASSMGQYSCKERIPCNVQGIVSNGTNFLHWVKTF